MTRRQQRRVISLAAFVTMAVIFTIVAAIMLWFLQIKAKEIIEVSQTLQIEQQKSKELESTMGELEKQNEQINKQVEELKEEIKELQLQDTSKGSKDEVREKVAYLTFDDGPSENTVAILDFLKEHSIPATFFVTGNRNGRDIYKRIVDEGHTLGNHTYGHDYNGIYSSPEAFFADVDKLNDLLEEATGQRSKILRFPGGSNNTISRHSGGKDIMNIMTEKAIENGYRYFDWNVDSLDASKAKQSKDVIIKSVVTGAQYTDRAVILMHDAPAKTTTVEALPEIIEGLTKQGFIFKNLDMETPEVQF